MRSWKSASRHFAGGDTGTLGNRQVQRLGFQSFDGQWQGVLRQFGEWRAVRSVLAGDNYDIQG